MIQITFKDAQLVVRACQKSALEVRIEDQRLKTRNCGVLLVFLDNGESRIPGYGKRMGLN